MKVATATTLLAALLGACRNQVAPAEAAKPTLYVLTSLPLLFDEGFEFELAKGAAATFLRERFTLKSIDLPSQLPVGGVLLAAQPRSLPAEELVALDAWLRGGGQMLLLADPMLEWSTKRPLGDRLRPPVSFADTGLLAHWGLRLDAPDKRGPRTEKYGDFEMTYLSPGRLVKVGGDCFVEADGYSASCDLGKGQVTILADADLLDVDEVRRSAERSTDSLELVSGFLERRLAKSK